MPWSQDWSLCLAIVVIVTQSLFLMWTVTRLRRSVELLDEIVTIALVDPSTRKLKDRSDIGGTIVPTEID